MNYAKIYSDSVNPPKKLEVLEENDSAQIILSDAKHLWMQNQFTQQLFNFLRQTKQDLLAECIDCVADGEKVKGKLHKAKQIQEVIDYASRIGTTDTSK